MSLPSKVVAGYWPTDSPSGSTLGNVHANYNVIYVAFAKGVDTTSGSLQLSDLTQSDASFRTDIAAKQAAGVKVILSIGGSDDVYGNPSPGGIQYELTTLTQQNNAISSLDALISDYGFDGIDIDLECPDSGVYLFTVARMANVVNALKVTYPSLIVTMAPESFDAIDTGGQYRALATALGSNFDAIGPQYYNHSVTESQSLTDILNTTRSLAAAYGPEKVMIGTMNHDDGHTDTNNTDTNDTITIATEISAWNTLVAQYPTLLGAYIWTTYFDKVNATNGAWAFATQVGPYILGGASKASIETAQGVESASVINLSGPPGTQGETVSGTDSATVATPETLSTPMFTVSKLNVTPAVSPVVPELTGYQQSRWEWVVGPWKAGPITKLWSIASRTLTIKLDEPDEASFTLLGDADDALEVHEFISDLWVGRNGVPLHRGRIITSGDSIDTTGYPVNFTTTSYAGMLNDRIINSTDTLVLAGRTTPIYGLKPPTSMKAHDVIWHLIDHVQKQPGMDLGITKGSWPDLPDTTLIWAQAFFQNGDYALQHIHTIARSMKFDFWIDENRKANIAASRGRLTETAIDHPGRAAKVERSITRDAIANFVRQSASVEGAEVFFTVPNIADRPEGGWAKTLGAPATRSTEDVILPKQLQAIGQANFDRLSRGLPLDDDSPANFSYSVTLENGVWRGPDHIWVGDTVRLVVKRGRLNVNELMKVYQVSISIDQNDVETVSLTLNWPSNAKDKIRNFANALWYLNRR